jgi:hypothetical protein
VGDSLDPSLDAAFLGRFAAVFAHSGDCDRPFQPKVITDSGDRDHAVMRPEGPA